jgi:hypothetical protein
VTDGARSQSDNKMHYHQTAAWWARVGICRQAIKLATQQLKSVCDGASNFPKRALEEAGASGQLLEPGARGAALYLVQNKPTTSKAKIDGGGYWQADLILSGSSKVHMSAGMCDDNDQAQREGPLTWLDVVCPCAPC